MIAGTATFVAGGVGGIFLSYLSDWFSATNPPGELADTRATEPPVRAVVVPERNQLLQGELWTYHGRLSQNPSALAAISGTIDNFDTFHDQLYSLGFHDTGLTLVKLLVEGRRNSPVRVIDIHARIVNRRPLDGAYSIIGPGAEGGTDDTVGLGFDLADQSLVARKIDSTLPIRLGTPFFAESTTELERGEQEVYSIMALAAPDWDVDWELVIEVVSAGASNPELVVARRSGTPFRTIATQQIADGNLAFDRYVEIYNYSGNAGSGSALEISFSRSTTFGP